MAPARNVTKRASTVAMTNGAAKGRPAALSSKSRPAVASTSSSTKAGWLMKAEPDPRMEKGIDISFSVDKFAAMPDQITPWDGVRNPEARTMMKDKMRVGDPVLFYHSNCKLPGIAGIAHVVKEGYPDYTAWDPAHPYFDAKTDKDAPKWYMVDVQLKRKLPHLVPLALLQTLRDDSSRQLSFLTPEHRKALSQMQLLNRGRLSVQHVEPLAFEAIELLGDNDDWQEWPGKWQSKQEAKAKTAPATKATAALKKRKEEVVEQQPSGKRTRTASKRK